MRQASPGRSACSSTKWSTDSFVKKWLTERPAWPPPTMTVFMMVVIDILLVFRAAVRPLIGFGCIGDDAELLPETGYNKGADRHMIVHEA